ncbi:MAG: helix-turn-helix transcriptional regulator [Nitrospira sp.]
MNVVKTFSVQLKRLRQKEGLTQARLAHKTKLSLGYVARLEQGRHDPPLSTLLRIAKALRVTVAELVE